MKTTLTIKQAAAYLGVTPMTLRSYRLGLCKNKTQLKTTTEPATKKTVIAGAVLEKWCAQNNFTPAISLEQALKASEATDSKPGPKSGTGTPAKKKPVVAAKKTPERGRKKATAERSVH